MTPIFNRLCLAALLILTAPLYAQQSQSLGDVARQARAERQQQTQHPRVWTNEDFESSDTHKSPDASATSADKNAVNKTATNDSAKAGEQKAADGARSEEDKREAEIRQKYVDNVHKTHEDIANAQKDLDKLKRDQLASANAFRSGSSPNVSDYEAQQQKFQQQIDDQTKKLNDLKQSLDDAREAARHAGVPHADQL